MLNTVKVQITVTQIQAHFEDLAESQPGRAYTDFLSLVFQGRLWSPRSAI